MKYVIPVFLILFAGSVRGQITLEHTYHHSGGSQFGLIEVDSGVWKYVQTNFQDSIELYNLDHSLDRVIKIPTFSHENLVGVLIIAKRLFTVKNEYAYLVTSNDSAGEGMLLCFDENGELLFSCDTCSLGQNVGLGYTFNSAIVPTDSGTKMIIIRGNPNYHEVYSLPGQLPGRQTKQSGVTPSIILGTEGIPISAYPNPSSGLVRIAYQLPADVTSGEIVLSDETGRELKRYRVTSAFSDLEIQESDLPSGSYFYRLVTSKGESTAERIVLEK